MPAEDKGSPVTDPLTSLLHASHLLEPAQLPGVVADRARALGAVEMVLYLADYGQTVLRPLPGPGVPDRPELAIEGTMAGRAYHRVEVVTSAPGAGGSRWWLPLLDGVERLGVVEVVFADDPDDEARDQLHAYVTLVAELLVVRDAYSDVFARIRRRRPMSLAAEMQWELLPPLTFGSERIVITGGLEPAYDVGGDSFDYAINGDAADLMVIDAVGHGLPAALLAGVAISAYRHGRRNGLDLPGIATAVDDAIAGQIGGSQFATAVLVRLDLETGALRWINAGHPPPLLLRRGRVVRELDKGRRLPFGLETEGLTVAEEYLQPGDWLALYTDGVVEARNAAGAWFGEDRLLELLSREMAAGQPPPETVRRLNRAVLDHQDGLLQDDASILLASWMRDP